MIAKDPGYPDPEQSRPSRWRTRLAIGGVALLLSGGAAAIIHRNCETTPGDNSICWLVREPVELVTNVVKDLIEHPELSILTPKQ